MYVLREYLLTIQEMAGDDEDASLEHYPNILAALMDRLALTYSRDPEPDPGPDVFSSGRIPGRGTRDPGPVWWIHEKPAQRREYLGTRAWGNFRVIAEHRTCAHLYFN